LNATALLGVGSIAPWVIGSFSIALVVGVIVWAARTQARVGADRREVWRSFARDRDLKWTDAAGPWYRRSPYAIGGVVDGVELRLDTFVVSNGKTSTTFTRVSAGVSNAARARIEVYRRTPFTRLGELLGWKTLPTNHAVFDRQWVVRSKSKDYGRAVIDDDVRQRLLRIPRHVRVKVEDRLVKVTWRGGERVPAVIEEATALAAALVRACGRA
jgi:hypothetical protein